MRYRFACTLPADASRVRIRADRFEGSAVSVGLDDRRLGEILHPPYVLDAEGWLEAGRHELTVDVYGNMKNMLGSHLTGPGLWGRWITDFYPSPQPDGGRYEFVATGLLDVPRVLWTPGEAETRRS